MWVIEVTESFHERIMLRDGLSQGHKLLLLDSSLRLVLSNFVGEGGFFTPSSMITKSKITQYLLAGCISVVLVQNDQGNFSRILEGPFHQAHHLMVVLPLVHLSRGLSRRPQSCLNRGGLARSPRGTGLMLLISCLRRGRRIILKSSRLRRRRRLLMMMSLSRERLMCLGWRRTRRQL